MTTDAQRFFSTSSLLAPFSRDDVLAGRIIKLNPALVTIIDGHIMTTPPEELQQRIEEQVVALLAARIRTFHVDINFPDYGGFGAVRPETNVSVFTPGFLARLSELVRAHGAYLNLHLLTESPRERYRAFAHIPFGAVCFQLDAIADRYELAALVDTILTAGACASPVIETVGAGMKPPAEPQAVWELLEPTLPRIGMLTFQAAVTASRSNTPRGTFAADALRAYIEAMRPDFTGVIQVQGGVTTRTVGEVVRLGAEFLVCGTEIFRHPQGHRPAEVIGEMLENAARSLVEAHIPTGG